MSQDARLSLQQFIAALERHFEIVSMRRSGDDPAVEQAYDDLKRAFEAYEEALDVNFEALLPFINEDDLEDD
ncbi:MAG: hypothetical protein RL670_257 [Actinomycetota bacterium]|jgi:hypothetical protein